MFDDVKDGSTTVQLHDDPQLVFHHEGRVELGYILMVEPGQDLNGGADLVDKIIKIVRREFFT